LDTHSLIVTHALLDNGPPAVIAAGTAAITAAITKHGNIVRQHLPVCTMDATRGVYEALGVLWDLLYMLW
jgi:hypothetical protein